MSLTKSQEIVYEQIAKSFKLNLKTVTPLLLFKVEGQPGTGKSYVASLILAKWLLVSKEDDKAFVAAPSNVALCNFKDSIINSLGKKVFAALLEKVDFRTIASLQRQFKCGFDMFSKAQKSKLDGYSFGIIDEYSMIDAKATDNLVESAYYTDSMQSLLFLGDKGQLSPVMGKDSEWYNAPLNGNYSYHNYIPSYCFELKENKRQNGELLILSNKARTRGYVLNGQDQWVKNSPHVFTRLRDDNEIAKHAADSIVRGKNNIKILTYTRQRSYDISAKLNTELAKRGNNNLTLRFNNPPGGLCKINEPYEIEKGKLFPVDVYVPKTLKDELDLHIYQVPIDRHLNSKDEAYCYIMHDRYKDNAKKLLKYYQDIVDKYDSQHANPTLATEKTIQTILRYIKIIQSVVLYTDWYVGTIHTSQGSTYDHVYLPMDDLNKIKGRKKNLLTVAYSRPKYNIYYTSKK